jgi:ubiquinone/menaquinone biosynthesis C-methylase UbiE
VTDPQARDHYSYAVYRDPDMARRFDDRRFGGPIGEIVAGTQARVLTNFIGRIQGRRILDVGTGTGRAALLLARGGAVVTGVDASDEMLAVARQNAEAEHVQVAFQVGDAHALQFPNRSFDVAVSLRVIMHTPEWRMCLGELCRVADQLVIVDYPAASSAAAIQAAARRLTHALGARTEAYRVFRHSTIRRALTAHGFEIRSVHRQFVLPIAFHKAIGSRRFTLGLERALERAGLLRLFGSPVTIVAQRCASS